MDAPADAKPDRLPQDSKAESAAPLSLGESLEQLHDRFSEEMSGSRQATRSHLIRFLASLLIVAEDKAERVFERLSAIGAVARSSEGPPEKSSQGWVFERRETEDADFLKIEADELGRHQSSEREMYRAAEDLLQRAIVARATDIHMDPFDDEVEVRFRIDGRLEHFCRLGDLMAAKTIAQLKLMAELDVAEPFEPQEGRLEFPASLGEYAARVTVVPVDGGEAVAIRLLNRQRLIRPLKELGFSDKQQAAIDRLIRSREGIVLVAGPTGSGKTTTLYSLLHALNDDHQNIVTIEDPIEFRIPSFLQMEVDAKHNVTHARALKTALRMDPDVVMLGEIRDQEAAAIAMRAADTGTYVFSTVHARDAASMLMAIRDLNIDKRSLANNLRAVIAQRLVRRLCPHCCRERGPTEVERDLFANSGLEVPDTVFCAAGCEYCKHTGYFDRIGVYEIVENTPEIATAIQQEISELKLRTFIRGRDISSLASEGLNKVSAGVTDFEELQRMTWVVPDSANGPNSACELG